MDNIVSFDDYKNRPQEGKVYIVDNDEFIEAVGQRMIDNAYSLCKDKELFRSWLKRLRLEEDIPAGMVPFGNIDALFWQAFIMGGMFNTAVDLDDAEKRAAAGIMSDEFRAGTKRMITISRGIAWNLIRRVDPAYKGKTDEELEPMIEAFAGMWIDACENALKE